MSEQELPSLKVQARQRLAIDVDSFDDSLQSFALPMTYSNRIRFTAYHRVVSHLDVQRGYGSALCTVLVHVMMPVRPCVQNLQLLIK